MEELLITKLHSYIIQNNPDLLLTLEGEARISDYLAQKVATVKPLVERLLEEGNAPFFIEEECMDVLTQDLRPSKFHYVCGLLQKDFPFTYAHLRENGLLTYAVTEIIAAYIDLFETHHFSEDDPENTLLGEALHLELLRLLNEAENTAPVID